MSRVSLAPGAMALVALSSLASAQPTLHVVGLIPGDMSADGARVAAGVYDSSIDRYRIGRYSRDGVATFNGGYWDDGRLTCNADASVMLWGSRNREAMNGFDTNRITPHYQQLGGPIVNIGVSPIGNVCDATINSGYDVSGDGRWLVGAGWTAHVCGPFRAWIYDIETSEYEILPFTVAANNVPARNTRADSVNADGTVVCGYDENYESTLTWQVRRAAAWRKVGDTWTEQILDEWGGTAQAVSADGNVIVGQMSEDMMQATFGTTTTSPVRWVWDGAQWVPESLGGDESMVPFALSADGSTVVGGYGGGFIWRADINGGEPIGFDTYLQSLGWVEPNITVGNPFGVSVHGLSADGSRVLAMFADSRSPCLPVWFNAIVDLDGESCEPVTISFEPQSQAIVAPDQFYGNTFNVFASGTGPLNFQWQKQVSSGVWTNLVDDHCSSTQAHLFDVKGSTTSQLRIGHLTGNYLGTYRCIVTNDCGSVTSQPASLTMCATPGIATQPQDATAGRAGSAMFSTMGAGGGPYTFQWRRDGVALVEGPSASGSIITGTDTQTLTISNIGAADAAQYDCVISNACQQTTSDAATLTVCAADFDGDGFVSGIDFDLYVYAFEAGDIASDFDGDGFITGIDFDLYVYAFEAGC